MWKHGGKAIERGRRRDKCRSDSDRDRIDIRSGPVRSGLSCRYVDVGQSLIDLHCGRGHNERVGTERDYKNSHFRSFVGSFDRSCILKFSTRLRWYEEWKIDSETFVFLSARCSGTEPDGLF